MIGPDGVGRRWAGNFITSVRSADRHVRVGFGSDVVGGERVVVELSLALDGDGVDPVTVRLSGTSYNSIEYATELAQVLQHAVEVARELEGIATDHTSFWWEDPNPELVKGIVAGRPDYMLCAYLILQDVGAFYARGREFPAATSPRVHDLEGLRATAARLLNEKVDA